MMCMSLIPCTSQCVYQQDGVCTLDSAAAAGLPALGGACVHFIPTDEGRLDRKSTRLNSSHAT